MRKRDKYQIVCIYDTETCNIGSGADTRAYPILFIDNDLRDVDLYNYIPGESDKVHFWRHEDEMIQRIVEYIKWGKVCRVIPVICAYNLMFDLQPLMQKLDLYFDIRANAQSSTNVYTIDLVEKDGEKVLLRFWDTYHLEMRGLAAMGETCGLSKAQGDWDYSLVRTPETKLTEQELYYARRDVQVIPAYLTYLLKANEWLKPGDFGNKVITKTSLVRQMARREIGHIYVEKENGKQISLDKNMLMLCKQELPKSFASYALRKACFRGGFAFTAGTYASRVMHNVVSLDVTSMHHTFINGRYIPENFEWIKPSMAKIICNQILAKPMDSILENYERPFKNAIHARIEFSNIRIKERSCFDKWGIALEAFSKFKRSVDFGSDIGDSPRDVMQENEVRKNGWYDIYDNAEFAFGKLYGADKVILNVTELELWCIGQVYNFDDFEVLLCEATGKFRRPPDFVTLQSNKLFEQKSAAKFISQHYHEGEPYHYAVSGIPDGIAAGLKDGSLTNQFFDAWYASTVKGMFNGIYGTQAQDVYKPSYKCDHGNLVVDPTTRTTPENFDDKQPGNCRVLYTYGMRIVGGSRMHMIISMMLLDRALGDKVQVLGGDTDSMKVACAEEVTNADLVRALDPIAQASRYAIGKTMERVRKLYPKDASSLRGVGSFDIENPDNHYKYHIELWNKCRVSFDGKFHVTCAGLPRPEHAMNIEKVMNILYQNTYTPTRILENVLGYNTFVTNSISHTLETHHPQASDYIRADIKDYTGKVAHVSSHESNALYETGRLIGDTQKLTNLLNVHYLERHSLAFVKTINRYVDYYDGVVTVSEDDGLSTEVIMRGEVHNAN